MLFFNKEKYQAGISHAEYAQYWRQNLQLMPKIALRLSAGMLPSEFFQFTSDPVELHDSKIQNVTVNESLITMRLLGDDSGGLRNIDIQYVCNGLTIPDIPSSLLENNPDCELMCHEFLRQDQWYEHRMLFANGSEIRVHFNHIMANVTPDHDKTQ